MFKFKKSKTATQDVIDPELMPILPKPARPSYRNKHLLLLNLILLVPLCSSAAVGYDGSMMNGLQTLPQWREYFNHPSAPLLGVINAVYPVCKILGMVPASMVADKWGRKVPIWIGLVVMLLGPALQASSLNPAMFIVSRGIIGIATVFVAVPSPILVTELAYPSQRGKVTSLYNTFFYFGAISAAWCTYGTFKMQSTWSWRIPSALQAGIPALQLLGLYFVPESPRWLIANGQTGKARAILTKYHDNGLQDSPLVDYEIAEIEAALELERSGSKNNSWLNLVCTAPNRRRSLIAVVLGFFSQWNGIGVVTYYLTLVLDTIGITTTSQQVLINGLLQLFNFAAAVFAGAMMVDKIGRRTLFLISTGGLCLSYVAWTALTGHFVSSQDPAAGRAVVAFIFIAYFFYDVAWTPLVQAYTIEVFPYNIRSKGLATTLTSSYLGLILGQLINPVALHALGWKYYFVFCCILACLFCVMFLLFPETKGRTLEQIAEIFDGKPVTAPVRAVVAENDLGKAEEIENPKAEAAKTRACKRSKFHRQSIGEPTAIEV